MPASPREFSRLNGEIHGREPSWNRQQLRNVIEYLELTLHELGYQGSRLGIYTPEIAVNLSRTDSFISLSICDEIVMARATIVGPSEPDAFAHYRIGRLSFGVPVAFTYPNSEWIEPSGLARSHGPSIVLDRQTFTPAFSNPACRRIFFDGTSSNKNQNISPNVCEFSNLSSLSIQSIKSRDPFHSHLLGLTRGRAAIQGQFFSKA